MARILCVDDEPKNLKLLEALLTHEGYDIAFASNGFEALDKTAADPPDLILLDVMMPGMSGYEVLESLRDGDHSRLIPVVMVTALSDVEDRVKALKAGCDDFISKPFDKSELRARVKSLLRISYYRRQLDEKEKFRAVVQDMGDGVIVCRPDWSIEDVNRSAGRYFNVSNSANGNILDVIFSKYTVSASRETLIDPSERHKTFDIIREETDQFKPLVLETALDILRNPAGEISHIVLTVRDVTAKRREETLKRDFVSLISHKLRTPLAVIQQSVLALQNDILGCLNEDQVTYLRAIAMKNSMLIDLVDKLLRFIAVISMDPTQAREDLDTRSYISTVSDAFISRFKDRKVKFDVDCRHTVSKIRIHKNYLDLILGNLIENAIKFNDKDDVRIQITSQDVPGGIEIWVADNGPGIAPEEQEKIFDKFYQIEKDFTGDTAGIGLGLAMARELAKMCKGKISVQSETGKGAKFILSLPN